MTVPTPLANLLEAKGQIKDRDSKGGIQNQPNTAVPAMSALPSPPQLTLSAPASSGCAREGVGVRD